MNANEIQVGAEVLVARYTFEWNYYPAKVVRTTKTWIVVKRDDDGATEKAFKKSNLREVSASGYRDTESLIIDQDQIKERLEQCERVKARRTLENTSNNVLNRLRSLRGVSDAALVKLIEVAAFLD